MVLKRVILYVQEKEYRELRAKLVLKGKTVSEWFRDKVKEFLKS